MHALEVVDQQRTIQQQDKASYNLVAIILSPTKVLAKQVYLTIHFVQSKIIFIDIWRVWKVLQEPAFEMWLAQEEHKSWMYVSDLIRTHFDNSKYVKYAYKTWIVNVLKSDYLRG